MSRLKTGERVSAMDKRTLTERDICTKFIMPALKSAGWDEMLQIREEVYFTNGRIIVRGKLVSRGKAKKADFVLHAGDVLMVTRIDRLARSIGDLQDIVRAVKTKGATLKATEQPIDTSTAAGKCF